MPITYKGHQTLPTRKPMTDTKTVGWLIEQLNRFDPEMDIAVGMDDIYSIEIDDMDGWKGMEFVTITALR